MAHRPGCEDEGGLLRRASRPQADEPELGLLRADGTYYFSDSGGWKERTGSVWVVRPGGQAEVWSEESVDFPNGCAVSADGSKLYLLESTPGMLVEYPINADGSAGARRVVVELPGAVPDGVAVTTDGSLVISCYRPDIIYRFREDLGLQVLAEDPEGVFIAAPTNVAFTGPDLKTMICPNIGRWHLTRFSHPDLQGVGLNYPTARSWEATDGRATSRKSRPITSTASSASRARSRSSPAVAVDWVRPSRSATRRPGPRW